MNRRQFTALLAGSALSAASPLRLAGARRSEARSEQWLDRLRQGHPRLHLDAAGFARLRSSIAQDPLLQQWYQRLQR